MRYCSPAGSHRQFRLWLAILLPVFVVYACKANLTGVRVPAAITRAATRGVGLIKTLATPLATLLAISSTHSPIRALINAGRIRA